MELCIKDNVEVRIRDGEVFVGTKHLGNTARVYEVLKDSRFWVVEKWLPTRTVATYTIMRELERALKAYSKLEVW